MQDVCQPLYQEGRNITGRAFGAAVIGKRFVAIVANAADGVPAVAHSAAAGRKFGVSGYSADAGATFPVVRKGVVPVTTGAALAAGDEVEAGAAGVAVKLAAGVALGEVLFDAALGADAFIALYE